MFPLLPIPDSRFPIPDSRFPTPLNPRLNSLSQLRTGIVRVTQLYKL
ncbi:MULTISPECIES: hypothetical protein [unclassified Moorena]|nr:MULTISPECIES: hypothetical protein [unclassified Moorena]NEO13727.1 hypothetical protein [Moorena sp. SIO3E8]NEP98392.1 hypothetical protein [Moorena sp. SIO3F7]